MRISDWSSDVCSSDILEKRARPRRAVAIDLARHQKRSQRRDRWRIETARETDQADQPVGAEQPLVRRQPHTHARPRQQGDRRGAEQHHDNGIADQAALLAAISEMSTEQGDRKSTRLYSSHYCATRLPSSAGKKKNNKPTQLQTH